MAFNSEPLFPGDLFDSGVQVSESVEQKLSGPASEGERAHSLERAWATVQELGWTVAAIPEELGGVGGGFDDIAAIAEGLARGGTSLCIADACLVAPSLLVRARGGSARAAGILKEIAAGHARVTCALAGSRLSSAPQAAGATVSRDGDRLLLRGAKFGAEACIGATGYLVLASVSGDPRESVLLLAPRNSPGLKETLFRRPDGRYCADLEFAEVALPADATLLSGDDLIPAIEQAVNLGALASCVRAQSAMAEILAQTIAYLSTRKQFSVTLSTFQVLRHRVADMYVAYENARAATQRGVAALHGEAHCTRAVSLAKINVGEAARFVAQSTIQVHGGMGMTEDLKAARLAKSVLMADFECGDRHFHLERARAGGVERTSTGETDMARLYCFLLLAALPLSPWAQTYPSKPVRIIVPYATGGITDALARMIAPRLADRWKQSVLVENRAGGGTIIGTDAASKAAPDGHTILLTSFGYTTNQILVSNLPYDPASLQPQALAGTAPSMLFVHPGIPARTLKEVIEYARSRPKQMMFASSGNASSPHIAAELFASMAGIEITHVPYKGTGPAMVDLLGGQVHAIFDNISSMTYARAGKLRPIAVAHKTRLIGAPEIPTVEESGLPNFTAASWFGFFLQAKVPAELAQKIYSDLRAVLETPEMRERLIQAGLEPGGLSREEFSAFLKSELDKWGAIIRARNIKLE